MTGGLQENGDVEVRSSEIDLFGMESLRNPFEDYRNIRDLGPIVYLSRLDVYAIGRFFDVQQALRLPEVLVSGRGISFNPYFNNPPNPTVIQSDGDRHRRMRSVIARPLTPAQLKSSRGMLADLIDTQIASLVNQGPVEGMRMIAQHLPIQAIAHLVGLEPEGREAMLEWAAASFNSVGPDDATLQTDIEKMNEARAYLTSLDRSKLAPGSWADKLFQARDAGRLSDSEARGALAAYVSPSLDTTILSKGNLLYNLARNPDQWALLRSDPSLIPNAVLEGVRHAAVVRWFARTAATDYSIDGMTIPKDARVMILYGSANRDERRYADPDRFDIRRDARDQLAWGTGPHMCAGMHLAQMEMEVMLEALVRRASTIEVEEPIIGANRGLYGFEKLTVTLAD